MVQKIFKYKLYISIAFIAFMYIGGFFFVRHALNTPSKIQVKERDQDDSTVEVKPVKILLTIEFPTQTLVFNLRDENTSTILDLLERLRDEGEISFEKTAYIYGTEIDEINGVEANEDFRWAVFYKTTEQQTQNTINNLQLGNDKANLLEKTITEQYDVTQNTGELNLVDEGEVFVRYISHENTILD